VRVVGRAAELATIDTFLTDGRGTLLIVGELGAGKTVLWEHGVARARTLGYRVLAARPVATEAALGFAALTDLLGDVAPAVIQQLPGPQRRALDVALLRQEAGDEPTLARSVATATLGVLRLLAAAGPILLAIDDIAYLDQPTARVLAFALRRIDSAPVRVLATARTGDTGEPPPLVIDGLDRDRVTRHRLGPLSKVDIRALLVARLPHRPSPALVSRVHTLSGGNPYLALELGRVLADAEPDLVGALDAPVPLTLRRLVQDRLDALTAPVLEALLTAALAPTAPVDTVVRALPGRPGEALARLESAAAAGVVDLRPGRVVFTHPLLRSVIIDGASPAERRAAHRRLARCATTSMERAAHLARSRSRPDAAVARHLDEAARQAYARGLADTAAELADLAVLATPRADVAARRDRVLTAAEYRFTAGDAESAFATVRRLVDELPPGPPRARALDRLAVYQRYRGEPLPRWRATLEQAFAEATDDDPRLRFRLHYGLGVAAMNGGEVAVAAAHVPSVVALADVCGDPLARAQAAAAEIFLAFAIGQGVRADRLPAVLSAVDGALELEPESRPSYTVALVLALAGDFAGARGLLEPDHREAVDRGDEARLPMLLWPLVLVDAWTGAWERAADLAGQALTSAVLSDVDIGLALVHAARAHLFAGTGDVEAALADATTAATIGTRIGVGLPTLIGAWGAAGAALSAGDPATAHRLLAPLAESALAAGLPEPGLALFVTDEVEALIRLGDLATARTLLDVFADRAQRLGRDRARAAAGRCRGLLLAAEGSPRRALAELEAALRIGATLGLPLEQARTLLVAGEVHRRARDRQLARQRLSQARTILAGLGARQWLAACEAQLARYVPDLRPGPSGLDALTPTERRVAELAAQGHTTRQIADAVFASPRTVETHLHRVYRKLHVRSRVELTRRLAAR